MIDEVVVASMKCRFSTRSVRYPHRETTMIHRPFPLLLVLLFATCLLGCPSDDSSSSTDAVDTTLEANDVIADTISPDTLLPTDTPSSDTPPDASDLLCGGATCDDENPETYDFCHVQGDTQTCIHNDITYENTLHTRSSGREYRWFVGHDWVEWGTFGQVDQDPGPPWLSELIWGTDLGISVELNDSRYFYMGDTWHLTPSGGLEFEACDPSCLNRNTCPECNDPIAISIDEDPSDGVTIHRVPFEWVGDPANGDVQPIAIRIPGVHTDIRDDGIWGSGFNVVTGAVTTVQADETETLLLWYATGKLEENGVIGRSWLARSTDGVTFENCLWDDQGTETTDDDLYHPFSMGPGESARFINIGAVEIDDTPIEGCGLPSIAEERGFLLYGVGLPYRASDVFLAYAPADTICSTRCEGDDCSHRWMMVYSGEDNGCWSWDEADAVGLLGDAISFEPTAYGQSRGLGELSVQLVDGLGFVMLSNEVWCPQETCETRDDVSVEVVFRYAPRSRPWELGGLHPTGAGGYGPHMIERFTEYNAGVLSVWHLSSTWWGHNPPNWTLFDTPYGVQTTHTTIEVTP